MPDGKKSADAKTGLNAGSPTDVNTNRKYKDSLFSNLFSLYPKELLKVVPVNIPEDSKVVPVTLEDTLFMDQINDLALLTDSVLLFFCEHMSTISMNLPIRLLLYASRTYEKLVDRKALYMTQQVKMPYPLFVVLYNGTAETPDRVTMKLSEAFEDVSALLGSELKQLLGDTPLDLTVTVFNINKGHNKELISKSGILGGYVEFTDRVRKYVDSGLDRSKAITKCVRECIDEGILAEYLEKHGSEVCNMLIQEWDTQLAIQVRAEEAWKKGIAEGEAKGIAKGEARGIAKGEKKGEKKTIKKMLANGADIPTVARFLAIPESDVTKLIQ